MKNKIVTTGQVEEGNRPVFPDMSGTGIGEPSFLPVKSREAKISVPTFEGLQMISVDDIVKCISHESYTEIFLLGGARFMVSRNLKEYERILAPFNFFRIHNSCLVNLRHVMKYLRGEGGYVIMADGHSCEVSRRKKQELLNRLLIVAF
jgi:two-component system LytT family response regulator